MGELYIRLNQYFVFKKGKKYFLTSVKKHSIWKKMDNQDKQDVLGKDVTSKVKKLIKKYGSKQNIHFITKKSKKKIQMKTMKKKKPLKSKKKGG